MTPNDDDSPTPSDEESPQPQATSTAPSESETEPEAQTPQTQPYVFSDGPEWARGRSAEEVLAMADSAMAALRTFDPGQHQQQSQPQQTQQPQMQNQNQPLPRLDPYDDNFDAAVEARARQIAQAEVQAAVQQFQPYFSSLGQVARSQVASDPKFKDVFSRWGHEVDQMLLNIPVTQRTVEVYQQAAKMVKSDHLDEVIAERVKSQPMPTAGTAGSAVAGEKPQYVDAVDEFWDSGHDYVNAAKQRGINKSMFREQAQAMGLAPKAYIEMIKSSPAQFTVSGVVRSR